MILIIDDFADGSQALCKLLGKAGYPCRWVGDAHDGLAAIRSHPPEEPLLVVLDDMMPRMTGIELLRIVRMDPDIAGTNIVFHSAGFDLSKRDEAISLGAQAWYLKGGTATMEVATIIKEIGIW